MWLIMAGENISFFHIKFAAFTPNTDENSLLTIYLVSTNYSTITSDW